MKIFPAIDIYEGSCVRLEKGDYNKMKIYNNDPVSVIRDFESKGVKYVHLVDLEGAKFGCPKNKDTIKRIRNSTKLFLELGGGIRTIDSIDEYLSMGIDRIILGTSAVEDKSLLQTAINKYGSKVAIAVDIKDGFVQTKGWLENAGITITSFLDEMIKIGVKTIIVTDISKDGMLSGTNIDLYKSLKNSFDIEITASGGITSALDVKRLKEINIDNVIIGKAYYEGLIDLSSLEQL